MWQAYCKTTDRLIVIPSKPARVYKNIVWNWLRDWLGTEKSQVSKNYLSFIEAKKIVGNLGLSTNQDWREYSKSGLRPSNLPGAPEKVYAEDGWKGWGYFLGKK